jgi:hypothetical protein
MSEQSGSLTYTARDGTTKEKYIESIDWVSINDDELARIDLKAVASFGVTQGVNIASSSLHSIDLSPLSSCSMLETLYLRTDLFDVDLSPLASCKYLRKLTLISNKEIKRIDLTPLRNCRKLESLNLSDNRLEGIDLSPLSGNNKFSFLSLAINGLENIDLTPLLMILTLVH